MPFIFGNNCFNCRKQISLQQYADEESKVVTDDLIARWPGKSANDEGIEHPALYHMLDVAAVAEEILRSIKIDQAYRQKGLIDALVYLTALHDLGKLNDGFRSMLREGVFQGRRHWEITEIHLGNNANILEEILKPERDERLWPLISATAGHHGRPSKLTNVEMKRAEHRLNEQAREDALETIKGFSKLWPIGCPISIF